MTEPTELEIVLRLLSGIGAPTTATIREAFDAAQEILAEDAARRACRKAEAASTDPEAVPVSDLEFPRTFEVRIRKALHSAGIETLDQLCEMSRLDLLLRDGLGRGSVSAIEREVASWGRALRVEP